MERFNWSKLDRDFIKAVVYSEKTDPSLHPILPTQEMDLLIPSLKAICDIPTRRFIMTYRKEIEGILLRKNEQAVLGIGETMKIRGGNYLSVLNQLSWLPMTTHLKNVYLQTLLCLGVGDGELYFPADLRFLDRVQVDIKKTAPVDLPMYDYQKDAVHALTSHFKDHDLASGLLVMPTGSGKTRTAVYFLLSEMVSRGYQVIWLAHRYMLLDQAAEGFANHAGLIKLKNASLKKYDILCVSGMHRSIQAAKREDTVIIASVPSVCRSLKHLKRILQKKVIIVVDEAHHTLAPSYQNTIKAIRKARPDAKLLGLTATPVRMTDAGSIALHGLYNNTVIYEKAMSKLITQGILAEPVFVNVLTETNFESGLSEEERSYISRKNDLPEVVVSRIAECKARNEVIAKTYLQKRAEYGKTLIFALNILHCTLLCQELREHGVVCDYIHSGRPENARIIQLFKDSELDVLVNVNIMTEGSDVPDIQTVMLTRPTQSEGFLMQMIGRGMRGINIKGTKTVNIVDFHDQWDTFSKWLNPRWLFPQIEATTHTPPEPAKVSDNAEDTQTVAIPRELIDEVYRAIAVGNASIDVNTSLPVSWYALSDDDGSDYPLLVYQDQVEGFDRMMRDREVLTAEKKIDAGQLMHKYFGGFALRPSFRDLEMFIDALDNLEGPPPCYHLEDRLEIDPVQVGKRIREQKLNPLDEAKLLYESHEMIKSLYGTLHNYTMKIVANCFEETHGTDIGNMRVEELPIELIPHRMTPVYDIAQLNQEVIDEMFTGNYDGISSVEWTDKPYRSYFGAFFFNDSHIVINCVLNSPDVPREAVKCVIYHELLHRDYHGHGKEFRSREAQFPGYEEHAAFLHTMGDDMDIKGW